VSLPTTQTIKEMSRPDGHGFYVVIAYEGKEFVWCGPFPSRKAAKRSTVKLVLEPKP
jgi:hypothetical protein